MPAIDLDVVFVVNLERTSGSKSGEIVLPGEEGVLDRYQSVHSTMKDACQAAALLIRFGLMRSNLGKKVPPGIAEEIDNSMKNDVEKVIELWNSVTTTAKVRIYKGPGL